MQNILITLCARGGSKGIPGKNIKKINGQHLIAYSINHASKFKNWLEKKKGISVDIELSTDSSEIKDVCKLYNLESNYSRSAHLANDTAGKQDVIKDVLLHSERARNVHYDLIIDLDVSAPMRTIEDLTEAFIYFESKPSIDVIFSVSEAKKNPYFNMVELNSDSTCRISKKPEQPVLSRQTAPEVFEMNASFYFYRRKFYDKEKMYLFENATIYSLKHDSFDLDHNVDFDFLEYLIEQDKLSFTI